MHRRLFLLAPLAALAACAAPPAPAPSAVVFFTADSAALDDGASDVLRQAAAAARANPGAPVRVLGFAAPDTGTGAFNRTLAQARAQNVRDALEQAGVPASRLSMGSRGAVPFELFPTEARRVEIAIGG